MKKIILALSLLLSTSAISSATYNIVANTNSVSVNGNVFPLNTLVLKVYPDSVHVQFYTVASFGGGYYYSPVTQMDSFSHFQNAGTAFTSVSQIDSFYNATFVK